MKKSRISLIKVQQRQSDVLTYVAKGITDQRELGRLVNASPATVNRDLKLIARRAAANNYNWINKKLPLSFQALFLSNAMIVKEIWKLLDKTEGKSELAERIERRELLQFLAALNSQKRNYLVDYDSVMLKLVTAPRAGISED